MCLPHDAGEEPPEGRGARHGSDGGAKQGTDGQHLGAHVLRQPVDDAIAHDRADVLILERGRHPLAESVAVDQLGARVSGDRRRGRQDRGETGKCSAHPVGVIGGWAQP